MTAAAIRLAPLKRWAAWGKGFARPGRLLLPFALAIVYFAAATPPQASGVEGEARRLRGEFSALLAALADASRRGDPVGIDWSLERAQEIQKLRDAVELLPDLPPGRRGSIARALPYFRAALDRLDAAVRELGPFRSAGRPFGFAAQELLHRAEEQWDQAEALYLR